MNKRQTNTIAFEGVEIYDASKQDGRTFSYNTQKQITGAVYGMTGVAIGAKYGALAGFAVGTVAGVIVGALVGYMVGNLVEELVEESYEESFGNK